MRIQEHIFLIDTCKSMAVIHQTKAVQIIIDRIKNVFKNNPYKLESSQFTIITFNSIKIQCLANKVHVESLNATEDYVCEGQFNLLGGIQYIKHFNSSINLHKRVCTPTLTIITGIIPKNDLDCNEIKFLKENFAVGTGIEDSIRSDGSPNWNWRYAPIIGTTGNKSVQDYYKRFFERVITIENQDDFAKMYCEYSRN